MRRKATDYLQNGSPMFHVFGKYAEVNGLPLKIIHRSGATFTVKDPNALERGIYHIGKASLPLWRRLLRWLKRV